MILIIDRTKRSATTLSDMFHFMGFISHAATPTEALSEISSIYRAVVITSPSAFPDISDFMKKLRSYAQNVPAFALLSEGEERFAPLFDQCFPCSTPSSNLALNIINYTEERYLPRLGRYAIAGIDVSLEFPTPTYFMKALPFTKTEIMILRFLIRTYPNPTSAEQILKYAYRPSRTPNVSNIRTHISVMNKKFRKISNQRTLINMVPSKGYVINSPKIKPAFDL